MTPSQVGTTEAAREIAQKSLQLQEYAQQLQVHFEQMEKELSQDFLSGSLAYGLVDQMQVHLKQIDEHVSQMRG